VLCPLWLSLASIGRIKGVAVLAVFDTCGVVGIGTQTYWFCLDLESEISADGCCVEVVSLHVY
jgi:hypothetical protein